MESRVISVRADSPVYDALQLIDKKRLRGLPVVDERKRCLAAAREPAPVVVAAPVPFPPPVIAPPPPAAPPKVEAPKVSWWVAAWRVVRCWIFKCEAAK